MGYDEADEPTSALSVGFSPQGSSLTPLTQLIDLSLLSLLTLCSAPLSLSLSDVLYAGYDSCIRIFDTATPGRDYTLLSLSKHRRTGQTGLISCLSASPSTFAAGSYSGQVGLYCPTSLQCVQVLSSHAGGVTGVKVVGHLLFAWGRGRGGGIIRCYDMRVGKEVGWMDRGGRGDMQRVEVEVGGEGRWVVSGGQDGRVRLWDLTRPGDEVTGEVGVALEWVGVVEGEGGGVVNGVSMHPGWGSGADYVATVSGCRSFPIYEDTDSESDGEQVEGVREGKEGTRLQETTASSLVSRLSLWQMRVKVVEEASESVGGAVLC